MTATNLYLLFNPKKPSQHAMLACVGTWSDGRLCPVCTRSTERLVEPLLVEWEDGTAAIGDFSWGGYTAVVLDRVREFMEGHAFEVKFGVVQVVKPQGRPRRPRVPFPYVGPHLNWLIPYRRISIDLARSGIAVIPDCPDCGKPRSRFKRDGLIVSARSWRGEKIFMIQEFGESKATFVTEEGLELLSTQNFSNFIALPAGQIVE